MSLPILEFNVPHGVGASTRRERYDEATGCLLGKSCANALARGESGIWRDTVEPLSDFHLSSSRDVFLASRPGKGLKSPPGLPAHAASRSPSIRVRYAGPDVSAGQRCSARKHAPRIANNQIRRLRRTDCKSTALRGIIEVIIGTGLQARKRERHDASDISGFAARRLPPLTAEPSRPVRSKSRAPSKQHQSPPTGNAGGSPNQSNSDSRQTLRSEDDEYGERYDARNLARCVNRPRV